MLAAISYAQLTWAVIAPGRLCKHSVSGANQSLGSSVNSIRLALERGLDRGHWTKVLPLKPGKYSMKLKRFKTLAWCTRTFTSVAAGAVLVAGCSAQSGGEDVTVGSKAQPLETNPHYYLRCNSTGWGVDQNSRLIPDSSGQSATLTYEVESPWMMQDSCIISQTNQLNGWGGHTTYRISPSPLVAPGSAGVTGGQNNFQVSYSELGTYTATLDLTSDTLSIAAGSGGGGQGGTACPADGATEPPAVMTRANRDGFFVTPTVEATEMPWGTGTTWSYTASAPPSGWEQENFNDSTWLTGQGGFHENGRIGDIATTPWPSGASDLWLRTDVYISDCDTEHLLFWSRWDDTMEVYINGVLASDMDEWSAGYKYLGIKDGAKSALRIGMNTIAVHVRDTGGGKYFDLGLVRNEVMSDRVENGPAATTAAVEEFAEATKRFMIEAGVPAGTLAVMKEDTLVLSRSFGYADKYFTEELQEGAVMRLASVDKAVSLFAMQDLLDSGAHGDPETEQPLSRGTRVYQLLEQNGLTPLPGVTVPVDSDIRDVTIGMLLDHRSGLQEVPSGWDMANTFSISEEDVTLEHNIRWIMSTAPAFTPGSQYKYCSACYMLVRHIVEVLEGDVVAHIRNVTLGPAADSGIFLAAERLNARQPNEPWYATFDVPYSRWANLEEYRALSATAPGLVRMLRNYEGRSGTRLIDPVTGAWSLGPNGTLPYYHTGGMSGTASLARQRQHDQVMFAFVFNTGAKFDSLWAELDQLADNMSDSDWGI